MKLDFEKMEGAGNDFIMINNMSGSLKFTLDQIKKISHRRFGIGCDQVIIAEPSSIADFKMVIYNSDGGEVEMCGNGIRCFAKYVRDLGLTNKNEITVETLAGVMKPALISNHPQTTAQTLWVKVDMGEPELDGRKIPVNADGKIISKIFSLGGADRKITCVSMGNPHCVIVVDDVKKFPVTEIGPKIETDSLFPNRINVEFIQVVNSKKLKMRVWERGAGETLACGTGACAAGVAMALNGLSDRNVEIELLGGTLQIEWDEKTNHVFMTGPATTAFRGEIEI